MVRIALNSNKSSAVLEKKYKQMIWSKISVLIMQENMLFSREICTAGKKNSGKSSLNLNEDLEKVASGPLGNVSFQP